MKTSEMNFEVRPYAPSDVSYDLFVGALGFETRATFVAERYRSRMNRGVAFGFSDRHVVSYAQNASWYEQAGFATSDVSEAAFGDVVRQAIAALGGEEERRPRILIDISSMTRRRIGVAVLEALRAVAAGATVDFLYTVARFSPPPRASTAVAEFGPVLAEFAGWPSNPEQPMVLLLGMGYEADRALGAAELLEPADCWALRPLGIDKRYDRALQRANEGLAEVLRGPERELDYRVDRPWETYVMVRSLVDGLVSEDRHRVIVIPFGPKMLALVSLLVQREFPATGVWRVSSGAFAPATDRNPSDRVIGLSVSPREPRSQNSA